MNAGIVVTTRGRGKVVAMSVGISGRYSGINYVIESKLFVIQQQTDKRFFFFHREYTTRTNKRTNGSYHSIDRKKKIN